MKAKNKRPLTKCGNCIHGGKPFKLAIGTHLHCEHPDKEVAGELGWGTLRNWYDTCEHWQATISNTEPVTEI